MASSQISICKCKNTQLFFTSPADHEILYLNLGNCTWEEEKKSNDNNNKQANKQKENSKAAREHCCSELFTRRNKTKDVNILGLKKTKISNRFKWFGRFKFQKSVNL